MATTLTLCAPCAGIARAIEDVPDQVFSQNLLGRGLAVQPAEDQGVAVRAPIAGTITTQWPHAVILTPDDVPGDSGVLVHLGIDTVSLRGEGFTQHAALHDRVAAGDLLVTWDTTVAVSRDRSILIPVVLISQADPYPQVDLLADAGSRVEAGDALVRFTFA